MSLNIKNERTVAMVRELAARTGASQTSAIEAAVQAQLKDLDRQQSVMREKRNARARKVLADLHATVTDKDRAAVREAATSLYDEAGLLQ